MIKNLVTVACARDMRQMLLHSHSIDKFVDTSITHYVYVQDGKVPLYVWEQILQPFYTRHKLKLYYYPLAEKQGHIVQQYLKIKAVEDIQDDYLILDSKNFFIKHTNLDYDIPEGTWYLGNFSEAKYSDINNWYIEKLKIEPPKTFWPIQTPFKVRKEVCARMLNYDLLKTFRQAADDGVWPSEFVLYAFFTEKEYNKEYWSEKYHNNQIYLTWWWDHQIIIDNLDKIYNGPVEILGLHRNVWAQKNQKKMKKLSKWLVSIGLDKYYVDLATIDMEWDDTELQDNSGKV